MTEGSCGTYKIVGAPTVVRFHTGVLNLQQNVIPSILRNRVMKREYWLEIEMYVL
jgi:hypothetical protein